MENITSPVSKRGIHVNLYWTSKDGQRVGILLKGVAFGDINDHIDDNCFQYQIMRGIKESNVPGIVKRFVSSEKHGIKEVIDESFNYR